MKKLECMRKSEQGFTLVELAIVMLIIGLLIGGVLKGAELIGNAEISSVTAQTKNIEAGTSGFRDKYRDFPGDMANANVRLPGVVVALNGNGNSRLEIEPGAAGAANDEQAGFWAHLDAGGFYSGTPSGVSTVETAISGVFMGVGYVADGTLASGLGVNIARGHWLAITPTGTGAIGISLTPSQAGSIDRKVDDGDPLTGSTRGAETTAGNCGVAGVYSEARDTGDCGLYVRFQS